MAYYGFPDAYDYTRKLIAQVHDTGKSLTDLLWSDETFKPFLEKLTEEQRDALRDPDEIYWRFHSTYSRYMRRMGKANPSTFRGLSVAFRFLSTGISGHPMTRLRVTLFLLALMLLIDDRTIAAIDLYITQPTRNFTTTNQTLVVEGGVASSDQNEITVTINTPAGVSSLSSIKPSIRAITMDLGSVRQLQAVRIRPSVDERGATGPRRILLAVSEDGTLFTRAPLRCFCEL